jgi:hypothetical protein
MKRNLFLPLFAAILGSLPVSAGTVIINPTSDFFTSAWAFGAPYVLDANDQLGVSTINPFGMGASPSYKWEETTYLTFDLSSLGLTTPVTSAILTFQTVARTGFPPDGSGLVISAHYLLSDPASIDPTQSTSYVDFKNNQIGDVVDSVATVEFGTYSLDLTDLVNDWISQGDTSDDLSTALTGRIGNDANPDSWVAIVNSGYSGGPSLSITTVPEINGALLFGIGTLTLLNKRRRS